MGLFQRILSSNNAFPAIRTSCGIEVYVTCGIGTRRFTGEGFGSNVKNGDRVKKKAM